MADYIDRDAAIETLRKKLRDYYGSVEAFCALDSAISILRNMPTPWINAKDRLPETSGRYLCMHYFVINGAPRFTDKPVTIIYYDSGESRFQNENLYGMKVSHWMPLPDLPWEE